MELYLVKDVIADHYRKEIHDTYKICTHYGVLNHDEFSNAINDLWFAAKVDGIPRNVFDDLVKYELDSHFEEVDLSLPQAA